MNRTVISSLIVTCILLLSAGFSNAAETDTGGLSSGLALAGRLGTLGPSIEATAGTLGPLALRAGVNYLPFSFDGKVNDVDYEFETKLSSVPVLLEVHPFMNSFHICGGFLYNRNRFDLDARLTDNQKIGDHEYTPAQIGTLSGKATFREWAPYLGLGFSNVFDSPDRGWGFVFDVGVLFQGEPDIDLTADGYLSGLPQFQEDLDKERADIQDKADNFQFYPVLSFGVSYTF